MRRFICQFSETRRISICFSDCVVPSVRLPGIWRLQNMRLLYLFEAHMTSAFKEFRCCVQQLPVLYKCNCLVATPSWMSSLLHSNLNDKKNQLYKWGKMSKKLEIPSAFAVVWPISRRFLQLCRHCRRTYILCEMSCSPHFRWRVYSLDHCQVFLPAASAPHITSYRLFPLCPGVAYCMVMDVSLMHRSILISEFKIRTRYFSLHNFHLE